MTPQLLLQHFNRLAEAPDAIPRLRQFILDLAVRGKLVEQDPNDEPASELLKRTQAEKVRLIATGAAKKGKPIPPLPDDERFRIPGNWHWSQVAEIGFVNPRNSAEDSVPASFVPMTLIPADYGVSGNWEVRPWGAIKSGFTHFADGDVVLAKITPCFQNGKSTVFRGLLNAIGAGTTELHVVRPVLVDPDYLLVFLKCPFFIQTGIPRMTGTAGQKRVPVDYFAYSPFPLPPLAEQHRIVTRVDELMALCDRLETAQAERESRRDRLVAATHARLSDLSTLNSQASTFFINHLPHLTTRPEHIQQLRQTILNLAVRGQLVPQNSNDQPAPEFGIGLVPDREDRLSLRLPTGWSWAKVRDVADARLGKMLDKAKNAGRPYRYLRNTNVHWFNVRMDELKHLRIEDAEIEKYLLRHGDVLICEGGHGIGRTAVWREKETDIAFQKALHRVRPGPALSGDFFAYCMFVYFHARVLQTYFTGVGIPHFTGNALSMLVFPLPPLAEQHRIVAKVDELMDLCDRLDTRLTTAQTDSRRLLEAVLDEAVRPQAKIQRKRESAEA